MHIAPQDTAFVTGAASGIGFAMSQAFAEAGMRVALADIDAKAVEQAAEQLRAQGHTVSAHALDVANLEAWTRAVNDAERQLGAIRLLCNNAGISALGSPLDNMTTDFWRMAVDINLHGVFNGIRTVLPRMKQSGTGGHIVNTASVAALGLASPGAAAYAASKSAVIGLSEVLQQEALAYSVGVTVLCPGPVKSQLWRTSRRLRGLPDMDTPPPESMRGSASPDALDPAILAGWVLDAVRANQFWCITHPEFLDRIQRRHDAIEAAFEPKVIQPA